MVRRVITLSVLSSTSRGGQDTAMLIDVRVELGQLVNLGFSVSVD